MTPEELNRTIELFSKAKLVWLRRKNKTARIAWSFKHGPRTFLLKLLGCWSMSHSCSTISRDAWTGLTSFIWIG